ncbi:MULTISPECIES: EamA family transporter RarD [Providencia]|uniref:Putative chloramphenical resistance permease RarD n=1 Tax=Providencia rettgeri TaxID=587 RepID=A0A379FXA7_PRORE|nr:MULTISPECIES: EamA family transporter RarD [Providencia]EJD6377107.1 EamA family transporter RarD [Providencia rettgeri]EJF7709868.1 EamA family transporter RarD [Providencia rettgeri]ELR5116381.1 EamA family transporter RarD [Providencia rettgeri]MBI6202678.1 EamA family transporter RarD [Providencia rettgeri]MCG5279357.1 EamA family transporter RarD [Providencia rettgeri]
MSQQNTTKGVLCALGAYFIWGVAPIYFKSIQEVPAEEILTHRIIWSFFFMILLLTVSRHWSYVRQVLKQPKKILVLGVTATTIACNWLIYIWAVNNGYMLQASLGYFINPLVNVLFGMLFLQERFRRMQWIAVGLALTGVLIQLWQFGSVPVIGLSLAVTFATYGLLRKKLGVDAQTGMTFETLWLLPVGIIFLLFFADSPTSNMAMNDWHLNALLIAAGVITTVPLLLFTEAANHLRLSTLGFFQYMGPSIMFLLAVFMYGEVMTSELLVTFGFIWVALILFTLDALYTQQKLRRK